MGFWALFSPVATGQKVWKMSKNRHFWRFWPKTAFLAVFARKRPFWAFLGLPRGLFYINPWLGGRGRPGAWESPPGARGARGARSRGPGDLLRTGPGASPGGGTGEPGQGPVPGSRDSPRTGFYINPSRRPPAVPGRGPRSPGSRRGSRRPPGASSGGLETPPPGRGGQKPPFSAPGEPRGPGARG